MFFYRFSIRKVIIKSFHANFSLAFSPVHILLVAKKAKKLHATTKKMRSPTDVSNLNK